MDPSHARLLKPFKDSGLFSESSEIASMIRVISINFTANLVYTRCAFSCNLSKSHKETVTCHAPSPPRIPIDSLFSVVEELTVLNLKL